MKVNGQWRRQDLLQGGAKLEIRSWGTHGGIQGRMEQLLDDCVTNVYGLLNDSKEL